MAMPERDGYIPGVPCWIDTSQPDPEAALPFYSGLFGWEFQDVMPPDAPGRYFNAQLRGLDVAAVGSRATELGGGLVAPPFDAPWVRMTVIADPQGATFIASQFVLENREVAG